MFRYFPYGTDVRLRYLPIANGAIITLTVLIFVAAGPADEMPSHVFFLNSGSVLGLVGNMWLHGNWWHLAGNMLFLWVFGNAVCSRVGNLWFPLVYLALGLMASAGEVLYSPGEAIGASGAINGVLGMFLVWFPLSNLKILWVAPSVTGGTRWAPTYLLLPLWFAFDVWGAMRGSEGIGYGAHIGGFVSGAVLAAIALRAGWVRLFVDERSLPEVLRLGWPAADQKDPLPTIPLEEIDPRYAGPPAEGALDRAAGELSGEPLLDGDAAPAPPAADPAGPSHFKPWRPAGQAVHARCLCGASLTCPPEEAGREVECPRCQARVFIPRPRRTEETP